MAQIDSEKVWTCNQERTETDPRNNEEVDTKATRP